MSIFGDYHTHTVYSHGKGSVEDNVRAALAIGLKEIAITDHGFSTVKPVGMTEEKARACRQDTQRVSEQLNIPVLLGVETNLVSMQGDIDLTASQASLFDVILCGFHYPAMPIWAPRKVSMPLGVLWEEHIHCSRAARERNTKAYISVIRNQPVDVLAHLNQRFLVDVGQVAKCAGDYGVFLELSTRHMRLTDEEIIALRDSGAGIILNSDAHLPQDVGQVQAAFDVIAKYDFQPSQIVNLSGRPAFRGRS